MIYHNESFMRLGGPWPIFIPNLFSITLLALPLSPTPFCQFDWPFLVSLFCNALYTVSIIPLFSAFTLLGQQVCNGETHDITHYPGPLAQDENGLIQVGAPFLSPITLTCTTSTVIHPKLCLPSLKPNLQTLIM